MANMVPDRWQQRERMQDWELTERASLLW